MQSRRDTTTPQAPRSNAGPSLPDVKASGYRSPRVSSNRKKNGQFLEGYHVAFLAQWLERAAVNRKVAGSIPAGGAFFLNWKDVTYAIGTWKVLKNLRDRESNPGHPRDRRIY